MSDDRSRSGFEPLSVVSPAERAEALPLVMAARKEQPDSGLAERVLGEITYRQRLFDALPAEEPKARHRFSAKWATAALSVLATAAAAAVVLSTHGKARRATAEVSPEPVQVSASSAISVADVPNALSDPCRGRVTAAGRQPLIDDFEDGDDAVLPIEGRLGLWRWVRDTDRPGTAPALLPIPQSRAKSPSTQALHVRGARLLDWGASIEFTFQPACYDARAYQGISLRAKGPGRIYLAAREVRLIPPEGGGTCQGSDCYNVHVKKFDLPAQYVIVQARWFEFQQRGYGRPPIDPGQLHSIAIFVKPEDTPYDLWLDDVRFID